jgi:predicted transglutaminase-like cysteine proteinase
MPRIGNAFVGVLVASTIVLSGERAAALRDQDLALTTPAYPIQRRLELDQPALPSLAHARFCLRYESDCKLTPDAMLRGRVKLTHRRKAELATINSAVNRAIVPEYQSSSPLSEAWLIAPPRGDCNDYAVTKRHELLARGWPTSSLLLAEAVTSTGEHHLVLIARMREGDLVLDNLHPAIRHWSTTGYRWIKMQSSADPKLWRTVRTRTS